MIRWASRWVWWLASRCAITLVCILTIQNILHQEGYYIEFKILLVGAACLIVGTRVWMRGPDPEKGRQDISWPDQS